MIKVGSWSLWFGGLRAYRGLTGLGFKRVGGVGFTGLMASRGSGGLGRFRKCWRFRGAVTVFGLVGLTLRASRGSEFRV